MICGNTFLHPCHAPSFLLSPVDIMPCTPLCSQLQLGIKRCPIPQSFLKIVALIQCCCICFWGVRILSRWYMDTVFNASDNSCIKIELIDRGASSNTVFVILCCVPHAPLVTRINKKLDIPCPCLTPDFSVN
jgi:hypothetical protein